MTHVTLNPREPGVVSSHLGPRIAAGGVTRYLGRGVDFLDAILVFTGRVVSVIWSII